VLDLTLEIKRKSGEIESHVVYPDSQIDFESKFGVSIVGAFSEGTAPKMTHLYYLAWLAEKNSGKDDEDIRRMEERHRRSNQRR
jgi:hypothetical protein